MQDKTQGRTNLLLRNGLYSVLSWAVPLALALLVTPVIVQGLGHEAYGLYAVIIGFISYSFAFGIGKAAAKYIAEFRASGETERISELVSSVLWISLGFGIAAVVVIGISARFIVSSVLLISPRLEETAIIGLYLGAVTILISVLSQVFQFVLQGLQRFDRFLFLTNLSALLLNLGSLLLVLTGSGLLRLLAWNVIVVFAVGMMFYFSARRLLPEFKLRFTITAAHWREALKYAISIVGYQIFGNMLLLFERGWIVRRFGAEALTFYVVPMMLCLYFHAFISSLALVLFPVVNELLADREKLERLYRTSSKLVLLLTAFFSVTAIVTGQTFLSSWMQDQDFGVVAYPMLVAHVATFGLLAIAIVAWQTSESFRAAFVNALVSATWFVVSVPLMVVFAERWGTTGIGWARFIGALAYVPLMWYVERELLGRVPWKEWLGNLTRIAVASAAAGAAEWAVLYNLRPTWPALIAAGLVGGAVFAASLLLTRFFDADETQVIRDLATRGRIGTAPAA